MSIKIEIKFSKFFVNKKADYILRYKLANIEDVLLSTITKKIFKVFEK